MSGPASIGVGQVGTFTATRSNGNTGAAGLGWAASGGCQPTGGVLNFADGGATTQTIALTAPASAGMCTVAIGGPSIGTLGSPAIVNATIVAATSNPVPQAGCPTPPIDIADFELKLSGADVQRLASGRIASALLPIVGTRASGQVVLGETTTSPRAAVVEISINRCRGVIDTTANGCYLRTDNPSLATLTWLEQAKWGAQTDSIATAYGFCQAYTGGTFYVNMRYTYSQCNYGTCGFVSQWNYGPY